MCRWGSLKDPSCWLVAVSYCAPYVQVGECQAQLAVYSSPCWQALHIFCSVACL